MKHIKALSSHNLAVGYDGIPIISGLDLSAYKGQMICLIGPNGVGKSTILRTLAGLLSPVQGTVYIGTEDLADIKPEQRSKQLAVVLTESLMLTQTTVYELVALGRSPYTGFFGIISSEDRRITEKALEMAGAADLAPRNFMSLSDGEKQKVLIARALAQQPEIIILDEPTSHLDLKHKIEVMRILKRLVRDTGLTVILVLHDVDIAIKYCQFTLLIKDGQTLAQGKPEEVIKAGTIDSLYGIENASYDPLLGSVEPWNDRPPEVFVAAGAGSGIPVYRLISSMGLGIGTGVLHQGDLDHRIAAAMKLTLAEEACFQPISAGIREKAALLIRNASCVVDSGFPVGKANRENIALVRQAAAAGKPCYSLRTPSLIAGLYGNEASRIIPAGSVSGLQTLIEERR